MKKNKIDTGYKIQLTAKAILDTGYWMQVKTKGKKVSNSILRLASCIFLFVFTCVLHLASCICLYGAFESFSPSPRVLSLGGAFIALSDDASAINTNPAGLVQLDRTDIITSYSDLYKADGLYRGHIAFAMPFGKNGIGISLNKLALPNIYDEDTVSFAFARQLSDNVALGMNIKIFSNETYNFEYPAVGGKRKHLASYDLGILYQLSDDWLAAAVAENISEAIITDGETINSVAKFGARYHPFENGLIVAEYNTVKKNTSFGFEVIIGEMLAVRLGLNNFKPSFGFGVGYKFMNFDAAILSDNNLGFLTQVGVRIKI